MPVVQNPPAPQNQHVRNTYNLATGSQGTQGAKTIFTVTGTVVLRALVITYQTDCTSGGAATAQWGVTGTPGAFTAVAVAVANMVTTKVTGTATTTGAAPTLGGYVVNANIILTIAGADFTGGIIVMDAFYDAVTDTGALS